MMEETASGYGSTTTGAAPTPPTPKTNETRIMEALESIASELFHIRHRLESVTSSGGYGCGDERAAIRTTGR
jgi:hypothetical protein